MKAVFVGGPWHGQVNEVKDPYRPIFAAETTQIDGPSPVLGIGQAYFLCRRVVYQPQRVVFFGLHLIAYVSDDMRGSPHLESTLGLALLAPEFREAAY